jgi:hypothetical protein
MFKNRKRKETFKSGILISICLNCFIKKKNYFSSFNKKQILYNIEFNERKMILFEPAPPPNNITIESKKN